MTLSFVARDAAGSTVVDQSAPITLQAVTARPHDRTLQMISVEQRNSCKRCSCREKVLSVQPCGYVLPQEVWATAGASGGY